MSYEKIVAHVADIYDRWSQNKIKKRASVTLQLSGHNEKERNQAIIKKEGQNKLNIPQNNRCSIVATAQKINEFPIEEFTYALKTQKTAKKKKKEK